MDQGNRTLEFLKLFVRHEQEINAYILTLMPHVYDANDLFQEGMTVMWKKFDQFQPGTNFAAWGVQIMRYQILDYHRNLARSKRVLIEDSLFETLMDYIPTIQDEAAERINSTAVFFTMFSSKGILPVLLEKNKYNSLGGFSHDWQKSQNTDVDSNYIRQYGCCAAA